MKAIVPRIWNGDTCVCIASGPSLTREDVDSVRGRARAIVINTSYVLAPWADVLYCADAKPFKWHWDKPPKGYDLTMRQFAGLKYSLTSGSNLYKGVTVLRRGTDDGLSLNPSILNAGKNSGYQAINLAVLLGATRILLLGYDMKQGPKGREHWHEDHPNKSRSPYDRWRVYFLSLVQPLKDAGVTVINCSRESALTCFPRIALAAALPAVSMEMAS